MSNKNAKLSSLNRRKRSALFGSALALMASGPLARAGDLPDTKAAPAAPEVSLTPQAPAPVGVFGAGLLNQGQWAVTYAPSWTRLAGNNIGTNLTSPQYIIQNVRSAHLPPAPGHYGLLRMVPDNFEFFGQTAAVGYGVTKDITLIVATTFWERYVNMDTFHPGTGPSALLGTSTGHTEGIGDTLLAGVWRVYRDDINQINVNMGFLLPTGSTTANQTLLIPSGVYKFARAFYGMQPGTGTLNAMPGVTYSGVMGKWSWGLAYRGLYPLDDSSQGWRYGDMSDFSGWGGYMWLPGLQTTLRLDGMVQGHVIGFDPQIVGFAQGANPLFYGGQWVSIFGGVNIAGKYFNIPKASLALEVGVPLYQNLNGPQAARALQANMALTYKF